MKLKCKKEKTFARKSVTYDTYKLREKFKINSEHEQQSEIKQTNSLWHSHTFEMGTKGLGL